jgi:multicomponent Na+:H+ antiporter subunit F
VTAIYQGVALILLANLALGLARIVRGPTELDRMLATQLIGTTGVAILLVLAFATGELALVDAGLVFALLAVIAVVAFVRRPERAAGGR